MLVDVLGEMFYRRTGYKLTIGLLSSRFRSGRRKFEHGRVKRNVEWLMPGSEGEVTTGKISFQLLISQSLQQATITSATLM